MRPTPRAWLSRRASVTLTPDALSRIYGDANPASGTATANAGGLVNGDTRRQRHAGQRRHCLRAMSAATTPRASNAVFGSGLATNYAIAYAPNAAGLVVTPRSLTLTPDLRCRVSMAM